MTTVENIYRFLDKKAPFSLQEEWDNSGLLAGDPAAPAERVLLALDITDAVIREAAEWGASLIVSHHPVIFRPIRRATLCPGDLNGCKVWNLARHNIAAICAHTNLDAVEGGVNSALARALGLKEVTLLEQSGVGPGESPAGIGRVGTLDSAMEISDFVALVKSRLSPAALRYVPGSRPVYRVAVGGGACGSMLDQAVRAGCDAFVTADLKYNMYLDAAELGLTLIDAGHFPTENVVMEGLLAWLQGEFPQTDFRISRVHREVIRG